MAEQSSCSLLEKDWNATDTLDISTQTLQGWRRIWSILICNHLLAIVTVAITLWFMEIRRKFLPCQQWKHSRYSYSAMAHGFVSFMLFSLELVTLLDFERKNNTGNGYEGVFLATGFHLYCWLSAVLSLLTKSDSYKHELCVAFVYSPPPAHYCMDKDWKQNLSESIELLCGIFFFWSYFAWFSSPLISFDCLSPTSLIGRSSGCVFYRQFWSWAVQSCWTCPACAAQDVFP